MSTGITKRVSRIISGSVHALVDAIEGRTPEMVMEQAIREIDSAMREVREELGRNATARHLASRRLSQQNAEHDSLADKAETAIQEGREDLAEAAIGRQLDIEAQIPVLEEAIADCSEKEKELNSYIAALHAKKREMEDELARFRESRRSATSATAANGEQGSGNCGVERKVDDATSAFDRVLARHTRQRLNDGVDANKASQLAELEDLSRKNRIKERLSLMKAEG